MRFIKSCTFLFVSKSKKLCWNLLEVLYFFRFLLFFENIFKMSFKLFHITFRSHVDSIENNTFKFSALYVNRKRLKCITVYARVFSSLSLKLRLSCTKTQTPPPLRFILFDVRPYNLKVENLNFAERYIFYPCFWKTHNAKFEVNCRIKFFEIFKILIHASNI